VRSQYFAYTVRSYYDGSLSKALKTVFPDVTWTGSQFRRQSVPLAVGYWNYPHNQKKFMMEAQEKLNLSSHEDWYRITTKQLVDLGGRPLLYPFLNK
jgi:hypothetical protein